MRLVSEAWLWIRRWIYDLRFPPMYSTTTGWAGDHVPAEIEYRDEESHRLVGLWAYGSWDPSFPYQGQKRP